VNHPLEMDPLYALLEAGHARHHRDGLTSRCRCRRWRHPTCVRRCSRSCSTCAVRTESTTFTSLSPTRFHRKMTEWEMRSDGRQRDLQRVSSRIR
jgi:hypothetical protein